MGISTFSEFMFKASFEFVLLFTHSMSAEQVFLQCGQAIVANIMLKDSGHMQPRLSPNVSDEITM